MWFRWIIVLAALGLGVMQTPALAGTSARDGIVKVKSAYTLTETIDRVKADIKAKNIVLFDDIDQAKLAADAGITLNPSHLIVFGNPPLGTRRHTPCAAKRRSPRAVAFVRLGRPTSR